MSQDGRPAPGRQRKTWRSTVIATFWHAACISFLTGCPYLLPAWNPMNHPPRIVQPATTEDLVLVMDSDLNQVLVFARDDDGDPLSFLWVPPPEAEYVITDGVEGALYYSAFALVRDPRHDGEELLVAVDDGQDEAFVRWTIRLPGGK